MNTTTYANIASARKAAKRRDYDFNAITFNVTDDGRVAINSATVDIVHVETITSPVSFVWDFVAANRDAMSRREIVAHLINVVGLNPNMTKTQVSRFYTSNGDRSAWYAIDRARTAERKVVRLACETVVVEMPSPWAIAA